MVDTLTDQQVDQQAFLNVPGGDHQYPGHLSIKTNWLILTSVQRHDLLWPRDGHRTMASVNYLVQSVY